jgi:PPIC-type PPIASE domain
MALPRFYEYRPEDVEALRVRHLRVVTEEVADEAMAQIRRGDATLAELASALSTDVISRDVGGDLGWWWVGESVPNGEDFGMNDELLGAAIRTRPNALSKIETPDGFHVFVVEDVRHKLKVTRATAAVAPSSTRRRRGADKFPDPVPMSYHIASMGCAMNLVRTQYLVLPSVT